jgi:hypothetical protein
MLSKKGIGGKINEVGVGFGTARHMNKRIGVKLPSVFDNKDTTEERKAQTSTNKYIGLDD